MEQCSKCGKPADYRHSSGKLFCKECVIKRSGLCAVCARSCKDKMIKVEMCVNYKED